MSRDAERAIEQNPGNKVGQARYARPADDRIFHAEYKLPPRVQTKHEREPKLVTGLRVQRLIDRWSMTFPATSNMSGKGVPERGFDYFGV
jgi:hypothetical protein